MTTEYLGVTDVAKRLGISTAAVSAYKLPEPDATIGRTRGWAPRHHRPMERQSSRSRRRRRTPTQEQDRITRKAPPPALAERGATSYGLSGSLTAVKSDTKFC